MLICDVCNKVFKTQRTACSKVVHYDMCDAHEKQYNAACDLLLQVWMNPEHSAKITGDVGERMKPINIDKQS